MPAEADRSDDSQPSADLARLEEFLEDLPEEQAQEYRVIAVERFFSGPLPPPSLYSSYERVLPGAAERIMTMTEKEQAHRHQWENTALRGEMGYSRLGLFLGTLALIAVIVGVVICAYLGQSVAAGTLGAIGLTGIVTALIKGRTFSHGEKEQNAVLIGSAIGPDFTRLDGKGGPVACRLPVIESYEIARTIKSEV